MIFSAPVGGSPATRVAAVNLLTSLDFGGLVEARMMSLGVTSTVRLRRALRAGRGPVALAALMTAALAVSAVSGAAPDQTLPELRTVVSAGDPDWTVIWQASTSEDRGQFRLYSGPGLDSLQLVDIQQATPGLAGYRYRDGHTGVPGWYYQLRYVSSKGEELVLGSLRVEPVGLQSTPASIHLPAPVAKALPSGGPEFSLTSQQHVLPTNVAVADAARPEPDVPPPRCSQHEA
jgi:hypothetical protein